MLSNARDSEDIEIVDQQENDPQNKEILKPINHHHGKPNNVCKNNKHGQFNESKTEIRRNSSSQSPSVVILILCDSVIKNLEKRLLQRSSHTRLEQHSGNEIPHKTMLEIETRANIYNSLRRD